MNKRLIIDGNNLLFRTFWTQQNKIDNPGDYTQHIFLFLRSVKSLTTTFKPSEIYCTWDKNLFKNETNFRKEILHDKETNTTQYKSTRNKSLNFDGVFDGIDEIYEVVSLLGVKNIFPGRMEADDVIAWLCSISVDEGYNSFVVSTDKDMLQLVKYGAEIYNPISKKIFNKSNFEQLTQLPLELYLDYRAIVGDESDNINGIPGIKIKTFYKKLVDENNNFTDNKLTDEQKQLHKRNLLLMDLSKGFCYYDDEIKLYEKQKQDLYNLKPNMPKFFEKCHSYGFRSIYYKDSEWKSVFTPSKPIDKQSLEQLYPFLKND